MPVKTALIGCGRIGYLLENDPHRTKPCTHYGGAAGALLPITHACDINEERLQSFSHKANIHPSHCYTDYHTLLKNEQPQCVIIATWTQTHVPIGIAAAECGAKVIICEKPIASDMRSANALINACNAHGTTLIVNHERRYDYRYNFVKRQIAKKLIGDVVSVHGFVFTPSATHQPDSGGGPLLHDGTHLIDTVHFLFGTITQVQGHCKRRSPHSLYEDYAIAHCITQSGVHVTIEAGGYRDYFLFELQVFGTHGKIVIGNGYLHVYTSKPSRLYTGFKDLAEIPVKPKGKPDYFVRMYKEAKKCLSTPTEVISSGHDACKTLEVITAVYYSASLQGKTIHLPLDYAAIDTGLVFSNF